MLFFFLSYARGGDDNDELVERFYRDLSNEVRSAAGEPPGTQVGFLGRKVLPVAGRWPAQVVSALARCQTFLALCSPRYFSDKACGQEWEVFERRLRQYRSDCAEEPPLLLPIVWWHITEMPPLAVRRQRSVAVLESIYHRDGLRQLALLPRHRAVYRDTVSTLANHIVTQALAHPLQPLLDEPSSAEVPNAFAGHATKSRLVHIVISAGTCASTRTAGRRDLSYYGQTPLQWSPYRPEVNAYLGQIAADIAGEDRFCSEVVDTSDIHDRLRSAMEHNQIVILLVDVWVSRINGERERLLGFVASEEELDGVPCVALLLPADRADAETQANWRHLSTELSEILPKRLTGEDTRRSGRRPVQTATEFEADLRALLQLAQDQVFLRGTVYGQVTDARTSPRPLLTLPILPGDAENEAQP